MPRYDSSKPSPLHQARLDCAMERCRDLEVSAAELYAYLVAKESIELTKEMQSIDSQVELHGTCEAYLEANEEDLLERADRWLAYLK